MSFRHAFCLALLAAGCGASDAASNPGTGGSDGGAGNGPDGSSLPNDAGSADGGLAACAPLSGGVLRAREHLDAWGVNFCPQSTGPDIVADKLERVGIRRVRCPLALTKLAGFRQSRRS